MHLDFQQIKKILNRFKITVDLLNDNLKSVFVQRIRRYENCYSKYATGVSRSFEGGITEILVDDTIRCNLIFNSDFLI